MWLIVGLGNPGKKYERNRHNIGFMVLDELAQRHGFPTSREKLGGQVSTGKLGSDPVTLLKPMEFMNLSGFPTQRLAQFLQIKPPQIIAVHDEIDLPFGQLRLKNGGGHGGHNGLRSISQQLGNDSYLRVRIGVPKPEKQQGGVGDGTVANYLLSDFPSAQQAEVNALVKVAADAVDSIVLRGMTVAMNQHNVQPKSNKKPQEP